MDSRASPYPSPRFPGVRSPAAASGGASAEAKAMGPLALALWRKRTADTKKHTSKAEQRLWAHRRPWNHPGLSQRIYAPANAVSPDHLFGGMTMSQCNCNSGRKLRRCPESLRRRLLGTGGCYPVWRMRDPGSMGPTGPTKPCGRGPTGPTGPTWSTGATGAQAP